MVSKCFFKDSFAVIGKPGHGPSDSGPDWIKPLWEKAWAAHTEIADICKKSEDGGLMWWGAMTDVDEKNKRWGETGKYLAGCEATVETAPPEGWTKWVIPAQTYLTVRTTMDKFMEVLSEVMAKCTFYVENSIHEHYPVPDDPSIVELFFPVAEGVVACKSCGMQMSLPEDFGTEADGGANFGYCRNCYEGGAFRKNVAMQDLSADVQKMLDVNKEHPGIISEPLFSIAANWLESDDDAKKAAIPSLLEALVDGQDCDLTGTPWEEDWLRDGKVCLCPACRTARRCVSDIRTGMAG